jgi:hypothetical protein
VRVFQYASDERLGAALLPALLILLLGLLAALALVPGLPSQAKADHEGLALARGAAAIQTRPPGNGPAPA